MSDVFPAAPVFPDTRVLVVDDDRNLRSVLFRELSDNGYRTSASDSGSHAIKTLEKEEYDVVLLDLTMPGMDGLEVLRRIRSLDVPAEVVVLTGNATVSTAVEAMKLGAYDYLTKPFKLAELRVVIDKAHEKKRLVEENLLLKSQLRRQSDRLRLITKSPLMAGVLEQVPKVARSAFPVLIYGESGVGKELIASGIHEASERPGAFVPLNCGALPEQMMESELFGHERGAFTGAHARKPGLMEIADRGTLFLDEIAELPLPLQVKLLRVIEARSFFRLGGVREARVDVKFLFATNKDLRAEADRGSFRSDLYYRISALSIRVPPLRERPEDIPLLVDHFIGTEFSSRDRRFSEASLRLMESYPWPGNVRELKNVVHRCLLLSPHETIDEADLPPEIAAGCRPLCRRLEDVERNHILTVLREAGGHRGMAAEVLGIDPKTLYRKLREYGVKE